MTALHLRGNARMSDWMYSLLSSWYKTRIIDFRSFASDVGLCYINSTPILFQRFSIGFRSGLFPGKGKLLTPWWQWRTKNWRFEEWFSNTLKNNTIKCKKFTTIVSGRKNGARPFVRRKQLNSTPWSEIHPQTIWNRRCMIVCWMQSE